MTTTEAPLRKAQRYAAGAAAIAGGSGGLGGAIARTLARSGANVAVTYNRNRQAAEEVAGAIAALGREAAAFQVDLRDADAVARFHAQVVARFGGLHTAVYAAGPYIEMRHIGNLEPALFERTLGSDVFGAYNFFHHAISGLRAARGVAICLGTPAMRRYAKKDILSSAPKAALESLVKGIAAEEGRHGIRANMVGVGMIGDGMFHELIAKGDFDERFIEATKKAVALGRLGTAAEIAQTVDFLASDDASYITGQTLMVDGGYAI
ncbi:SDR family oxidoreductase [Vineibacter terrae]|uniref:SDR family oxidoreductase n=1 Tax=Vineibacter terrae TaxID=2586908 RepID=A0A5C8PLU5_9HYPH|nr:SDR family oxidoreductase [Vineibacter terrae]TXL75163.1 SDR family oxidoreductase [Vineibacter terrae]